MEGVKWQEELLKQAEKIMIQGGQLHFIVIKRQRERIPEIRIFPENFIKCKTETLVID